MTRRARFEVFRGEDGWRWHVVAPNGQLTATSGEAFASRSNARRALAVFKRRLLEAEADELGYGVTVSPV